MKALVLNEVKQPLVLQERPSPEAGKEQIIVKLKAAALNRRDYWITQGLYPGIQCPVVDEVFALSEGNKTLEKMNISSQFGKLVLRVSDG